MVNNKWIVVWDLETTSPNTDTADIVEIAALPIHPRTLQIREQNSFKINIRPEGIDDENFLTDEKQKTLEWHAKTRNTTTEEIIKIWKGGIEESVALKNFCSYLGRYNIDKKRGQWYTEPISSGYNIRGFDEPILRRKLDNHKLKWPFSKTTMFDTYDIVQLWFENLDEPNNLKMDTLRDFFDMKAYGQSHEALSDVMDEAKILIKFMQFMRKQASVQKFKGAFASENK